MARQRWTGNRSGSWLFLIYASASLVPIVTLGAVLVRGYEREAVEDGLRHGRAQAAVIEEMAIAPALREVDLSEGLTTAERRRLEYAPNWRFSSAR